MRDTTFQFRLTQRERAILHAAARELGIPASGLVRTSAVERALGVFKEAGVRRALAASGGSQDT